MIPISRARFASVAPRCALLPLLIFTAAHAEESWFDFTPANDNGASVIGCEDWLDKPAGRHGRVTIKDDRLVFADGTPVKFWGLNNCNDTCAPKDKGEAETKAAWYAKYGVNAVRQHKFVESIGDPQDTTILRPDRWDALDYYFSELKKRGIYSGWSAIYYLVVHPADKSKLLAYDEIKSDLGGKTMGLVNFAPDVQDLHIALLTNLLKHKNPYTGLTYAEDPALAYVEFQNEDDIFFWSTEGTLNKRPTYKKLLCEQFSDWLKKKYTDQAGLMRAWGDHALNFWKDKAANEALDARTIYPQVNPWFSGPDGLKQAANTGLTRRILDTTRFLYERQRDYYERVAKALRAAGYQGAMIGSCWQAAPGLTHYYNLHADAQVGIVDRHNYFGGMDGWKYQAGKCDDASQLAHPGSGLLSTGMQAVKGKPFSMSEWNSVLPNEWAAESAAIIGVYGMGLQGWDMSYQFASDGFQFSPGLARMTLWNCDVPTQLGLYPALARMIARGDVQEGALVATRKVCVAELGEGRIGFSEKLEQQGDLKVFTGAVPNEALAAGKVEIEFTATPEKTTASDLSAYLKDQVVTSTTSQLVWDYHGKGCFTVNTSGTKAVVGFAPGRAAILGGVTITPANDFAVIFVTSLEKGKTITEAKSLLITAVARARNSGMRFNAARNLLEDAGRAPLQLEAVRGAIVIEHAGAATVTALDQDGRATAKKIAVDHGAFSIDTGADQTIYYRVSYP